MWPTSPTTYRCSHLVPHRGIHLRLLCLAAPTTPIPRPSESVKCENFHHPSRHRNLPERIELALLPLQLLHAGHRHARGHWPVCGNIQAGSTSQNTKQDAVADRERVGSLCELDVVSSDGPSLPFLHVGFGHDDISALVLEYRVQKIKESVLQRDAWVCGADDYEFGLVFQDLQTYL